MSTIFNILFTSLVSLNFSSNCLCLWEFSYISLGFWGFPVVLIFSILSICLWYNWCVVSRQINTYLLSVVSRWLTWCVQYNQQQQHTWTRLTDAMPCRVCAGVHLLALSKQVTSHPINLRTCSHTATPADNWFAFQTVTEGTNLAIYARSNAWDMQTLS